MNAIELSLNNVSG